MPEYRDDEYQPKSVFAVRKNDYCSIKESLRAKKGRS